MQTHHLPRCHANSLYRELPPTHVEQVFEAGTQQVDDEDVVQALLPKVVYLRDAGWKRGCTRLTWGMAEREEED